MAKRRRKFGRKFTEAQLDNMAKELQLWAMKLNYDEGRFTLSQFAQDKGLSEGELVKLVGMNIRLSNAFDFAVTCVKNEVIKLSLDKKISPVIAKHLLNNLAGMTDRANVDVKHEGKIQFIEDGLK